MTNRDSDATITEVIPEGRGGTIQPQKGEEARRTEKLIIRLPRPGLYYLEPGTTFEDLTRDEVVRAAYRADGEKPASVKSDAS